MSIPPIIGRYRVVGELGRGGMGVVYHAVDPELERPVAVKLIQLPAEASQELRDELEKRFRREAKAAARIRHPGVVAIHDVGSTASGLFLVMELVEGESLASRLERGHFPSRNEAVQMIAAAADALAAAHRAGVVHRDVKPGNILLSNDGRVMLTDFGVARGLDEVSELTRTGMVVGSPAYMAPEQLQGITVDGRADLFSLGVVCYELLLRKRPFPAQSITTLLYQILHDDPLADPALTQGLDAGSAMVLRRFLAKNPDERFQDATSAAVALRALRPDEGRADDLTLVTPMPTTAGPPPAYAPPTAIVPPPPQRLPPPPPMVPPTPMQPFAAPPTPPQQQPAASGLTPLLWFATGLTVVLVGAVCIWLWWRSRAGGPPLADLGAAPTETAWDPANGQYPDATPLPTIDEALVAPTPVTMLGGPQLQPETQPTQAGSITAITEPQPPPGQIHEPPPVATAPPPVQTPTPPPPPPAPPPHIDDDYVFTVREGIEFDVKPDYAVVWVDGQRVGRVQDFEDEPYHFSGPGSHIIKLTADGYAPAWARVNVSADARRKVTEIEIDLEEEE